MCDCDDAPSIYEETHVVARKPHTCCECLSTIEKGQKYVSIRGLWEGRWANYKQCFECHELVLQVSKIDQCCIAIGFLMDYLDPRDGEVEREWLERREANYNRRKAERKREEVANG